MSVTAILPLKSQSQRVPGKNWRLLGGRPLYRHILDTLLAVPLIDRILVETDADLHLGIDRVRVIARPAHLRGHTVSMNRIIDHVVRSVSPGTTFLQTHATNPFLSAATITAAIDVFDRSYPGRCDSLFSVTRIQGRLYDTEPSPLNHDPGRLLPTQDLPPVYLENSCLYLFTDSSFRLAHARIGHHPHLFETPPLESLDIDTEDDWAIASALCA